MATVRRNKELPRGFITPNDGSGYQECCTYANGYRQSMVTIDTNTNAGSEIVQTVEMCMEIVYQQPSLHYFYYLHHVVIK